MMDLASLTSRLTTSSTLHGATNVHQMTLHVRPVVQIHVASVECTVDHSDVNKKMQSQSSSMANARWLLIVQHIPCVALSPTLCKLRQRKDIMEKTQSWQFNCHFGRCDKLALCGAAEVQKKLVLQMLFFVCCLATCVQMTQLMLASAQC